MVSDTNRPSDMPAPAGALAGAGEKSTNGPEQDRHENGAIPGSPGAAKRPRTEEGDAGSSGKGEHAGKKARYDKFEQQDRKHGKPGKRGRDASRKEYMKMGADRRQRNTEVQAKNRERELAGEVVNPMLPKPFSAEEIAQEERKPKRKVAVLIGYNGTGYKGMQLSSTERTIEGDLFTAFVEAGAISKANATDPKKSQFVRCARTDKGVHAAGNVISINLIIEDPDIVKKINEKLSPQIRVWGFLRTIKSFNCYAQCDSRYYEYLLPTHTLLPPRPGSYLGRKLDALAKEADDYDAYKARQADAQGVWEEFEATKVKEALEAMDPELRPLVEQAFYDDDLYNPAKSYPDGTPKTDAEFTAETSTAEAAENVDAETATNQDTEGRNGMTSGDPEVRNTQSIIYDQVPEEKKETYKDLLKSLKQTYREFLLSYRLNAQRRARLQEALDLYVGTQNFHNYTVMKSFKDPSAKRNIKSFVVGEPFIKHNSEWVSLKVHGQSFMMHQIRKMVAMAVLAVRCGSPLSLIPASFGNVRLAIPKAPGLGLLLERPVFDMYNQKQAASHEKEFIDFGKYESEIAQFKQNSIYEQIWNVEEKKGEFLAFFKHVDTWKEQEFLYFSSKGTAAVKNHPRGPKKERKQLNPIESDDEDAGSDH